MYPMIDVVQRLDVKVISNEECKTCFGADSIKTSHICAVSSSSGYLSKVFTLICKSLKKNIKATRNYEWWSFNIVFSEILGFFCRGRIPFIRLFICPKFHFYKITIASSDWLIHFRVIYCLFGGMNFRTNGKIDKWNPTICLVQYFCLSFRRLIFQLLPDKITEIW